MRRHAPFRSRHAVRHSAQTQNERLLRTDHSVQNRQAPQLTLRCNSRNKKELRRFFRQCGKRAARYLVGNTHQETDARGRNVASIETGITERRNP